MEREPRLSPSSRAFDALMNLDEVNARVEQAIKDKRIDRPSIWRYRRGLRVPDIKTAALLHELTGVSVVGWIPEEQAKGAA